jgi:hypothetical protein
MNTPQICVRCGKLVPVACLEAAEQAVCANNPALAPASFAVEVIADKSGKWCGNGARYLTEGAAKMAAQDLMMRWFSVTEWRVVPSPDKPTWALADDGRMVYLGVD